MLNRKVIHKTLGEGTIVKFENNIATVEFSSKTTNFRYLSNDVCVKILNKIIEVKSEKEKSHCEKVLARFRELKGLYVHKTRCSPY